MKRCILFSLLFITTKVLGADVCKQLEIKGTFRIVAGQIYLFVNEGSQSELKLPIKSSEDYKSAPYLGSLSVGTYVVKNIPPNGMIIKVEKIEKSLADPLSPKKHSFLKQKGEVRCI